MTSTRLAVIDTGQVNERILNKDEYRADFRKVEGASLKRTTHLSSPHAKRLFARCFYSFQASMYFISELGRVKLDHDVVERIEQNIRESLDSATAEINTAIDQAEALLKHHNIDMLASYDTVPLQVEIGITSSFGRRYFDLMHKLDVVMPMMETLAIEEIINERELETRRSMYKRAVLHISTRARNLWMGVRRRMNERDARLAAEAAKPRPTGQRTGRARQMAEPWTKAASDSWRSRMRPRTRARCLPFRTRLRWNRMNRRARIRKPCGPPPKRQQPGDLRSIAEVRRGLRHRPQVAWDSGRPVRRWAATPTTTSRATRERDARARLRIRARAAPGARGRWL